jgi:hypothetical protein
MSLNANEQTEHTRAHVHALRRVCLQIYKLMSKSICIAYISAHALVLKTRHLFKHMSQSTQKMHVHPGKHARATVQQILCLGNHCDLSEACNLSSAQETIRIHASLWRSLSCVVTQASSYHPHWCGPHPVYLWFALVPGRRRTYPSQKSISTIFALIMP